MPRVQLTTAFRVDIIESERGWGQKIDETIYFDNEAEDWYMRADYVGQVR